MTFAIGYTRTFKGKIYNIDARSGGDLGDLYLIPACSRGNFKQWSHMLGVQGAIDCTHIHIVKPRILYPKDYYYHKTGGYSIIVQTIFDSKKRFIDLYIRILGFTNDS